MMIQENYLVEAETSYLRFQLNDTVPQAVIYPLFQGKHQIIKKPVSH